MVLCCVGWCFVVFSCVGFVGVFLCCSVRVLYSCVGLGSFLSCRVLVCVVLCWFGVCCVVLCCVAKAALRSIASRLDRFSQTECFLF